VAAAVMRKERGTHQQPFYRQPSANERDRGLTSARGDEFRALLGSARRSAARPRSPAALAGMAGCSGHVNRVLPRRLTEANVLSPFRDEDSDRGSGPPSLPPLLGSNAVRAGRSLLAKWDIRRRRGRDWSNGATSGCPETGTGVKVCLVRSGAACRMASQGSGTGPRAARTRPSIDSSSGSAPLLRITVCRYAARPTARPSRHDGVMPARATLSLRRG